MSDLLSLVTSAPFYVLSFIALLTLLVFVHELGHFLVARRNGVHVEVFSVGFGAELFGWTDRHGTRWKFSALPLGGYVKMLGESPVGSDGQERPLTAAEQAVSFAHKRVGQRAAIVFAGPAANFLLTLVLLAGLFYFYGQQFRAPVVGEVMPGTAAEAAGLKPGDRILALNGEPVEHFEEIAATVRLGLSQSLDILLERDGQRLQVTAVPNIVKEEGVIGRLGITAAGESELVHHSLFSAMRAAAGETYRMTVGTLVGLGQIFQGLRPADEVGGPLRIAKMAGEAMDLPSWFGLAAMLSISLGLINLFPVPMLDGGHLAFYAVEALRGRPLGARAQEWGFRVGLALVLSLMVFATWNDLVSLKIVDYIKGLVT